MGARIPCSCLKIIAGRHREAWNFANPERNSDSLSPFPRLLEDYVLSAIRN